MNEMHHEPTDVPTITSTPANPAITAQPSDLQMADLPIQLTLDLPEVAAVDPDEGAIDLSRFRLDEHTRELGRRQVALIKAQLAERAAQRAA
jgi:hypothetical protein